MGYDVVALGEALIDFTEAGVSAGGERLFEQNPGGAPANLICALAKFGLSTAFIGKVGGDMHGRYLRDTLNSHGVNTEAMITDQSVFTTLAFVSLSGGERSFSFARKPGADMMLRKDEIPSAMLVDTRVFHFGSLSLTAEPVREATLSAIKQAKRSNALISYDPNYRAALWSSEADAVKWMREPLDWVDIMKLSDEEMELITGKSTSAEAAEVLHGHGIEVIAITLGKAGAYVSHAGNAQVVAGFDTPAVDTTGAGDSFWAGFLHGLIAKDKPLDKLSQKDLYDMAMRGNASATLCVSSRGAIPAMPSPEAVENLLLQVGQVCPGRDTKPGEGCQGECGVQVAGSTSPA